MSRSRTDHVVALCNGSNAWLCERCGTRYAPAMPCPIDVYVAAGKAFLARHRHYKKATEQHAARAAEARP